MKSYFLKSFLALGIAFGAFALSQPASGQCDGGTGCKTRPFVHNYTYTDDAGQCWTCRQTMYADCSYTINCTPGCN
jgi:hypothetical protein